MTVANADSILFSLLLISIVLGIMLAFISAAAAGRTLSDLERQSERGITGSPRIQAWVNMRTHINRLAFGFVFVLINVLLVAGAPEVWRMWANRGLWTLLLASFVGMAILDWIAEREQVRLSLRELADARTSVELLAAEAVTRRTSDAVSDRESYRQIADEAVANLELATNRVRQDRGEPPIVRMAAVVPEHNSPVTQYQQEVADAATLRARLVAATLGLGLPPREAAAQEDVADEQ